MVGLQKKHDFTMSPEELNEYVDKELGAVTQKLLEKCQPCEGAPEVLEKLSKEDKYPRAVVSTSAKPRVVASLQKTDMIKYFREEHVFSAATSLNPPSSKPDPAIYLHACKVLGVEPGNALAVEDSKSGATAAKRAGIPLIGYVGVYLLEDGKEKMDQMVKVLTEECDAKAIMYNWSEFEDCLKKIEES
jgi:HAD superfamily hydrolase (TIGR01509 family)